MQNLALVLAAALLAASCEQEPDFAPDPQPIAPAQSTPAATVGVDHPITQAEYDQVAIGMSVQQAVAVLGDGCIPSATTGSPGQTTQTYVCVNASGASAVFTFENGALSAKSSTGDLDALDPPPAH